MKIFLLFQRKKRLIAGYLETFNGFGVVRSYRATAESASARKACSAKKIEQKKSVGSKKREGRNLLSLFVFSLRAKKMVSDSLGLVEYIGLVNSVVNLPDRQVMFVEEFE